MTVSRPTGVIEVISASCGYVRVALEGVGSDFLVDTGSIYTIVIAYGSKSLSKT